jgi:hypothetical protein
MSTLKAAAESLTAEMAPAKAATYVAAANSAAHVGTATTETAAVSPTTASATRKRLKGQSRGENCSHSQKDQGLP